MGKVNEKRKSLKWDFVKYFLVCTVCILLGSVLLGTVSNRLFSSDANEYILYIGEAGNIGMGRDVGEVPERYLLLFYAADLFQCTAIPLWSLLCVVVCGTLFYRRKIEKPVRILSEASGNISENRLDFSVEAPEQNELGSLCLSFEKMRAALQDNYLELWRQVEERKRLNAVFAHDLRTPLTVLKGQSQMLIQYAPKMSEDKIISTAEMMKRHIIRLEDYVNTMNDLQKLEDVEIIKRAAEVKEMEKQMRVTGMTICGEKEFVLRRNRWDTDHVTVDAAAVMQVYENLLSNAVRYAESRVEVSMDRQGGFFVLTVADDGAGFTPEGLANAMKPFYRGKEEPGHTHFGMGLNICKTLCEKHGGYLRISNDKGAKAIAAFKE